MYNDKIIYMHETKEIKEKVRKKKRFSKMGTAVARTDRLSECKRSPLYFLSALV
jgi:hypothetical protein